MRNLLVALLLALAPVAALAHHGWSWTTGENVEVEGVIREVDLGMPHGVLTLDVEGEVWQVEVGQPWRNHQAGLADDMLVPDVSLTLEGHRSRDPAERRMKAERVIIAGTLYDLYPDRS